MDMEIIAYLLIMFGIFGLIFMFMLRQQDKMIDHNAKGIKQLFTITKGQHELIGRLILDQDKEKS